LHPSLRRVGVRTLEQVGKKPIARFANPGIMLIARRQYRAAAWVAFPMNLQAKFI
jgi:hypothetical protein